MDGLDRLAARALRTRALRQPGRFTVRDGHDSRRLTHGGRRARSVLLLHGYTHTPAQLDALAAAFHARGYNVVVPRAPGHGLTDPAAHAGITAAGLAAYAAAGLDEAAALGEETGVVGVSGGGVLATWLAAYRPDAVRRLLVLAPLYAPHAGQVPAALRVPLQVLYGLRWLPDRVSSRGYSYRAVGQYLRLAANLPADGLPPAPGPGLASVSGLTHVAAVVAPGDTVVDARLAHAVPARLARAPGATLRLDTLPAALDLRHDIASPAVLGPHTEPLNRRYIALYEDTPLAEAP